MNIEKRELRINPNGSITLCGGGKKCCPVMSNIDENTVEIIDDYGNKVILNKEQAKLISSGIKILDEGKEQKQQLLTE